MKGNTEVAMELPKPELFAGNWNHLFGPGRAETECRIVIDVANDKLVAAQAFDGLKWVDLCSAERADLAESLFVANEVSKAPEDWSLSPIASFPQWASPREVPEQRRVEALQCAAAALRPFADIGAWLFARMLPDDTPVVDVKRLNGAETSLTRDAFKAAFMACQAIETQLATRQTMSFEDWIAGVEREAGSDVDGESYRRYYDQGMSPSEAMLQDRQDDGVLRRKLPGQADPIDLLIGLIKWAEHMGGWEAPVWEEAFSFVAAHGAPSLAKMQASDGPATSTDVRKTVIQFTVLHDDGKDLSSMSLGDIVCECDEGGYVGGGLSVVSNAVLTREQLDVETEKLGSDATFFVDNSMDEQPTPRT
ncbi:hypothetical protein P3T23_008747 [Paraburkholderia sp. GAS448]|uniref:hypothetical protein n=1 Tax=Paraburkholderia sp. GAS448 TaxID=3035136 RepID=UPI003D1FA7A8